MVRAWFKQHEIRCRRFGGGQGRTEDVKRGVVELSKAKVKWSSGVV